MNLHNVAVLKELFAKETPLGPAATGRNPEYAYLDIYHPTDRFEKSLGTRHNVVFGRRGAGKSSLIQRILRGTEYDIKIALDKDVIIESLKIKLGPANPSNIYCESISRLWIHLFWIAVFKHILSSESDLVEIRKVREYLHVSEDEYHFTVTQCVTRWIERQTEAKSTQTSFLASVMQGFLGHTQSDFNDAKEQALKWLSGRSVILLLDSQERYFLDEEIEKKLVGGLLNAASIWQSQQNRLFVKVFFPSELYFRIKEASENEAKDFEHAISLKWNARDLFTMLIKRLLVFEKVHGISKGLDDFERLSGKARVEYGRSMWAKHFPATIVNGRFNIAEDSIAYFMRHCQLLPRQVVILGNKIAENYQWPQGAVTEYIFSESDFKTGIKTAEKIICSEVFKSFSIPYPNAAKIAERYLRQFRARFGLALVHEVKARLSEREFEDYKVNPMLFERMLIELGIVGRRIEEGETQRYYRAEFEYYLPDQLHVTDYDDLLIHPIFLETYGVVIAQDNCPKAIYPQGADLDELAAF